MNVLLNRLLAIINNYPAVSTEYHIASVFLEHLYDLGTLSVNQVADLCSVSKSTISKFVREIGFDDYLDFRLSAKASIEGVRYNWGENITDYIAQNGLANYLEILRTDLSTLYTTLEMEKIQELAQDLHRFQKVAAFGTVYSETAALDLQYKLAFMGKILHTSINDKVQEEYISSAGEDTLIIIFTNSGRYITEYQLIEGYPNKGIFDETKAKIVAVTSNGALAHDDRVDLCIHYQYSSQVQTHPVLYQVITDLIAVTYQTHKE